MNISTFTSTLECMAEPPLLRIISRKRRNVLSCHATAVETVPSTSETSQEVEKLIPVEGYNFDPSNVVSRLPGGLRN